MRRLLVTVGTMAAGLLLGFAADASYLEQDPQAAPPERQIVPPPPKPVPTNPLTDLVRRISVRPGHTHKGLTVFLVTTSRPDDPTNYLSLTEALESTALVITEKGAGNVPILLARNRGRRPVLMLAGEMIVGGKQNRTLRDDILLPARSDLVELPVYCVEQGRWSGEAGRFEIRSSVAALNVRAAAIRKAPQAEVWANVDYYQKTLAGESPTGDLHTVQSSKRVRRGVEDYRKAFADYWRPKAIGMVVARGRRIVGADLFCNAAVFRKHRDRLLESYAVDCIAARANVEEAEVRRPVPMPSPADAERFLRRVLKARFTWRSTPGVGRLLDVTGKGLRGAALIRGGAALHACLLAPVGVVPRPPVPLEPQLRQSD